MKLFVRRVLLYGLAALAFAFGGGQIWMVFANGWQGGWGWSFLSNPAIQWNNPSGVGSLGTDTIDVPQSAQDADEKILDGVKKVINYILWLLALITLILLIRGWLQMLFAAESDDGYKKWFTILKNAAIALAFIAFSWLLVSLIFYVLDLVTGP